MVREERLLSQVLYKIKTPHYLTKKFLMRMGPERTDDLFSGDRSRIGDEEFYPIVDAITQTMDVLEWKALNEYERRDIIEHIIERGEAQ